MKTKIIRFLYLFQSEISFVIVGLITTTVNILVFISLTEIFNIYYLVSNAIAWIVAVVFAYFANRKWVFRSNNKNILIEFLLFVSSRIFSLLLETTLLFVSVEILHINEIIAKVVISAIVVLCNYLTGKLFVFKRRK